MVCANELGLQAFKCFLTGHLQVLHKLFHSTRSTLNKQECQLFYDKAKNGCFHEEKHKLTLLMMKHSTTILVMTQPTALAAIQKCVKSNVF